MGSQPPKRTPKPEWKVVVGAIVTASLERVGLKAFDKPLKNWFLLMSRHWALSCLLVVVAASLGNFARGIIDDALDKTRSEGKTNEIKSLTDQRDDFRGKDVDLMISNGSLQTQLKVAENAFAPWKQLAMDKFPNDPISQAMSNMLRIIAHEIPKLPIIAITSLAGLPPQKSNDPNLMMVELLLRNTNDVEIDNLCSRLQLPEPIVETEGTSEKFVGTQVEWRALLNTNILVKGGTAGRTGSGLWISGGGSAFPQYSDPCFYPPDARGIKAVFMEGLDTGIWELQVDRIPPGVSFPH